MTFNGQTVLLTGACGNLGRAVAARFAREGANLVLVDKQRDRLEQAFGSKSSQQLLAPADLLDQDRVNAVVKAAVDRFQRIDVLCNLAGGFRMGPPVHESTDSDWDFVFDVNVRSLLHTVRAVAPRMIESGSGKIINIAANAALRGQAHKGPYCAAKDAVIRLTESMAAELRDKQINVNCILPGIIDTPENRADMPNADPSRWVSPDALADAIAFLASYEARAIHGAAIPITGLS